MPDLTFFPDPNVDRVLGVVLELAAEVYVLRDRLQTLERVLEQSATLTGAESSITSRRRPNAPSASPHATH